MEKLYSIKEVAEILQVTERSVFRYMEKGRKNQLKAAKIGGVWRISEKDIHEFINNSVNNSRKD